MRYSQGDGVHTPCLRLVLYPRSVDIVILVSLRLCSLVLPSARSCAGWDNNNKYDVCTRTIPAGPKCPPPSTTISLITWFEAYLNTLSGERILEDLRRSSVFNPRTPRQCRFYIGWKRRNKAGELRTPPWSEALLLPPRSEASPAKEELD